MNELPANQLDPRIKNVWRINGGVGLTVAAAFVLIPLGLLGGLEDGTFARALFVLAVGVYLACLIVWLCVLPSVRYLRWRYEVSEDYLDIAEGIIWRKRYVIPFIRVQDTDTRQGPILRAFGLASVTVSTAAGDHEIPGLDAAEADRLRDRAAELARLAREDV